MISGDVIEAAGQRLAAAARQPARVLLFGSHARGDAGPDSDLDFLVIERDVPNRHAEMVRLGREVASLGVPIDVLVVSEEYAEEWGREEHGRPRGADRRSRVCRRVTRDLARRLLRRADDDATLVRRGVDEADIADAIVGFHAQQASSRRYGAGPGKPSSGSGARVLRAARARRRSLTYCLPRRSRISATTSCHWASFAHILRSSSRRRSSA
jgi:predicted nucleotidyltransferase